MRYKVRVERNADFDAAKAIAADNTEVYVISDRRRTLSTGDLNEATKLELRSIGAQISPDVQFEHDSAGASSW